MKHLLLLSAFLFGIILNLNSQTIDVITQEHSKGVINHLIYSPNGKLLASGSEDDPIVKIWDIKSGKIIGKLDAHDAPTSALKFSPDGTKIISADTDSKVIYWDIMNWTLIDSITLEHTVNDLVFESEATFYSGDEKGNVHKWNTSAISSPESIYNCGHAINRLDLFKTKLVIGTKFGQIASYDLVQNKELIKKKSHLGKIVGLKFFNDGKSVVSSGGDGVIHFWNIQNLEESKHIKASNVSISAFDANEDKDLIIVANNNKTIHVYSFKGELLHTFKAKDDDSNQHINAVALSPDGTTISSAKHRHIPSIKKNNNESSIQIWDLNRGIKFKTLRGEVNPIYSFDFHPTQNRLITLGGDRIVTFWDFETAEKYGDLKLQEPKREIPPKRKQLTVKKGKKFLKLATSIANGNIPTTEIKKTGTNVTSAVLKRAFREKSIIKYSSKGSYLITKLKKDEIRLYSLEDRKPEYMKPLFSYQPNINNMMCSPDETELVVLGSGDSAISIIDLKTGNFIRKLSTPAPEGKMRFAYEATSMAFSPDGKYLAVCFNTSKTFIYETKYWKMVFENALPNNLGYVKGAFVNFSETGKYIIVNTMLGVVKYNIQNYEEFDGGILKTKGTSIPLDKASDYAVTVHEGYLYFENTVSGGITKSIKVEPKNISHVSVKNNGLMGVTLISGQFMLLDPKTGEPDILLVANGDNYIFKTHENYYKVSKEGFDLVTFRIGNEAYPFEQFDAVFNRPDLVLNKLESKDETLISLYKKAYEKRIKKLGLKPTTNVSLNSIPKCKILNTNDIPAFTENSSVNIKFDVSDAKLVQSYNIWVNNVPVYGKKGKSINLKSKSLTEKLDLVYGTNKIQVASRNADGYESLMETFYVEQNGVKPEKNLYLISIGTSKYKESKYDLSYPVKDAKDLQTIFSTNSTGNYDNVNTKTLFDNEVTVDNVKQLSTFLDDATANDVVILFVAGHGVLDANFDYYFATFDMDFNNPQGKGLAYDDLEGVLDGIKAKRKILIMDTCHSGEIDDEEAFFSEEDEEQEEDISFRAVGDAVKIDETKASPSKMMNLLFNDLRRGTGATVISSAGGAEYAMESAEWKNGLFTYCMLMGLKNGKTEFLNADLNKDGEIHLIELQTYVTEKVKGLSHGKQIPNSRIQNLELDFRVW